MNPSGRDNPQEGFCYVVSDQRRAAWKMAFCSVSSDRDATETAKTPFIHGESRRVTQSLHKFERKDIVWATYNGELEPVIIINCRYDGDEHGNASEYELLWLRWVDTSDVNGRMGQCSVSVEAAGTVINKMTDEEFARLTKQFGDAAKSEIMRWRPRIYEKYWLGQESAASFWKTAHQYFNPC